MLKLFSARGLALLTILVVIGAALSFFSIGQVSAQTACTEGQVMCYPCSGGGSGWCQTSPCPSCSGDMSTPPPTTTTCPDGTTVPSGTTCPTNTLPPPPTCASDQIMCYPCSGGGSGWCQTSPCPSCSGSYTPPASTTECGGGMTRCYSGSSDTAGWCQNPPCPITCPSGQWKCYSSPSDTVGYCTSTACPAVTTTPTTPTTCPSGQWKCYSSPSDTMGYCTSTACPAVTTTPTTPTTQTETTCASGGGKWCKNSDGATGWCSYGASACPAYDSAGCAAQGGDWCTYTSGTGGWCNSSANSCPIYDKVTCEAKGRKWCVASGTTYSSPASSSGWCATPTETCSGTTTTPTPMPTPVFSWPSTQADCESYYGLWCKNDASPSYASYSSGSCNMGNQTCPAPYKSGYMSCWNNTQVPITSSCPTMPTTSTDCKNKGYYWCVSSSASASYATSGWCSSSPCSQMPPAGQMTCPDGKSFAATLSGCPKNAATIMPLPEPTTTTLCPDGSKVVIGTPCSGTFICWDGKTVSSSSQCAPKPEDPFSVCMNKNGVWCTNQNGVQSGYCLPPGSSCAATPVPTPPPEYLPVSKPQEKPQMPAKQIEREKRDMLRELRPFESYFKKIKDNAMLAKITALKEKIQQVAATDPAEMDTLRALREEMEDARFAYRDAMENTGQVEEQKRDEEFQRKALKDLQRGLRTFTRFLSTVELKIKRLEKDKITVDQDIKDALVKAKEMAALVQAAKSYDEVKETADQISNMAEDLNEFMPRLEQSARIPKILKLIDQRVSDAKKALRQTTATAKRLKFDASEEIQKMENLLAEIQATVANIKIGSFEGTSLFEYIQDNILDKVDEIIQISDNVSNVANVKRFVNQVSANLKKYDRKIAQLERKKEDVSEAVSLLDEIKMHLDELKTLSAKRFTADIGSEIIIHLQDISGLTDQLEESLKIASPTDLEAKLRKSLEGGAMEFKPFQINTIEKLMLRSYRTANFFRFSPSRTLSILSF